MTKLICRGLVAVLDIKNLLLVVTTIAVLHCHPTKGFAQGDLFGQNLNLFSLPPHTDHPEVLFVNNGWTTKIEQDSGHLLYHTDSRSVPFFIHRNAGHKALKIIEDGIAMGVDASNNGSAITVSATNFNDLQTARITLCDNRFPADIRTMLNMQNLGPVRMVLTNIETAGVWAIQTNRSDGFMINRHGSGGNEFSIRKSGMVTMGPGGKLNFILDPSGNLQIDGTLSQSSDRDKKEAFAEIDEQKILDKVTRLPITSWHYKDDQDDVRHIGPMAQDFYREFQVGTDDKTIATVDADGVALAAIQALKKQLDRQFEQFSQCIADKDRQIANLERRVVEIEALLSALVCRD